MKYCEMEATVKCYVCGAVPQYTCPRCSIRYCSVACYKDESHLQCSESFYKEEVMSELKNMKGSPTTKCKMMEMLKRQNDINNGDEDLSDRLSDVHLDDFETLWERLNDNEKHKFNECLVKGNVNFLAIWTPWWECSSTTTTTTTTTSSTISKMPSICSNLPRLDTLTNGKEPSDKLKYNVIEVLLAYSCVMRVFNGDLYDVPCESSELLFHLSNVLNKNHVYNDVEVCLLTFIQTMENKPELNMKLYDVCFEDLVLFLKSNNRAVVRCMSDLHVRLKKLRKILKTRNDDVNPTGTTIQPSAFQNSIKKIYFFLVYCNENGDEMERLGDDVLMVHNKMKTEEDVFSEQQQDIVRAIDNLKPKNTCLIEEL